MNRKLLILGLLAVAGGANATVFTFFGGPVTIPALGPATTVNYNVVGLDGPITNVSLRMSGVSHTFPDDIGAVLANNAGGKTLLFDGPGDGDDIVGLNWLFDDSGATALPNTGILSSGVFKPGQNQYSDVFTNIAGPYGSTMAGLNGGGNGTWSLYVQDFVGGDSGTIQAADLIITTQAVPEPATMAALGLGAVALIRRRRNSK